MESNLQWSPEGSKLAFIKGNGDLWIMDADGSNSRRLLEGWSTPQLLLGSRRQLDRLRPG